MIAYPLPNPAPLSILAAPERTRQQRVIYTLLHAQVAGLPYMAILTLRNKRGHVIRVERANLSRHFGEHYRVYNVTTRQLDIYPVEDSSTSVAELVCANLANQQVTRPGSVRQWI